MFCFKICFETNLLGRFWEGGSLLCPDLMSSKKKNVDIRLTNYCGSQLNIYILPEGVLNYKLKLLI